MKKIFVCALIACLMLSCFSPAVAKAEESKRIDYTTVTDAINGKGIGDAGVGVIYRYYIDNELYFEKEVLYCVSYPDGYDYTLGDVFVLQTYDDNRGRIALYGSQSYSNMAVTVYSKTYDYLMELNGETTVNTYTEKSCAADAASAVVLADDEIYLFNYEYVNSSNETIRVEVSDKYAWGFGAYSYYDDSNTLQTSTIRRTAPLGYRVSIDENGYKCFVRASLSFTSNLDADGFESYVRELIAGEYSSFYIPYGVIVTDSNGCDYGSAFEFYFDCDEPVYLYYIDNKLYAYSDAAFTVVARGYFGDAMVYYYEDCEAGSNMIYQYYVSYGETIETDSFIVEYSSKGLNNYVYPATNGGFTSNEVEQEDFSSAGTTFTAIYEPYTYEEFLDAYEAANSDTPIGSTPTPTPTPSEPITENTDIETLLKSGFAPTGFKSAAKKSIVGHRFNVDYTWDRTYFNIYHKTNCYIEMKVACLVGKYDAVTGLNSYEIEYYDINTDSTAMEYTTCYLNQNLLYSIENQTNFYESAGIYLNRYVFGYPYDYGIDYPYDYDSFCYIQMLGTFVRYRIKETDTSYYSDWRFFEHSLNPEIEYEWLDTSCLPDVGLTDGATYADVTSFDPAKLDSIYDYLIMSRRNDENPLNAGIDYDKWMSNSVWNSIGNLISMYSQMLMLVGSVPSMLGQLFQFLPNTVISVFVFGLCFYIAIGIVRLFR